MSQPFIGKGVRYINHNDDNKVNLGCEEDKVGNQSNLKNKTEKTSHPSRKWLVLSSIFAFVGGISAALPFILSLAAPVCFSLLGAGGILLIVALCFGCFAYKNGARRSLMLPVLALMLGVGGIFALHFFVGLPVVVEGLLWLGGYLLEQGASLGIFLWDNKIASSVGIVIIVALIVVFVYIKSKVDRRQHQNKVIKNNNILKVEFHKIDDKKELFEKLKLIHLNLSKLEKLRAGDSIYKKIIGLQNKISEIIGATSAHLYDNYLVRLIRGCIKEEDDKNQASSMTWCEITSPTMEEKYDFRIDRITTHLKGANEKLNFLLNLNTSEARKNFIKSGDIESLEMPGIVFYEVDEKESSLSKCNISEPDSII